MCVCVHALPKSMILAVLVGCIGAQGAATSVASKIKTQSADGPQGDGVVPNELGQWSAETWRAKLAKVFR